MYDYRGIDIDLGTSPGHVEVRLGDTRFDTALNQLHSILELCTLDLAGMVCFLRVFACVSCHVIQPRPQRPTEGQLYFNVELSPMASPGFEVGRPSSVATEITRTLERCVKESRAVDLESLCIIAGEKVSNSSVHLHHYITFFSSITSSFILNITSKIRYECGSILTTHYPGVGDKG